MRGLFVFLLVFLRCRKQKKKFVGNQKLFLVRTTIETGIVSML